MIAKGKAIQHGNGMVSYAIDKNKGRPIIFNHLQESLSPEDVWSEMELHRVMARPANRNVNAVKCNTLRFEISPQNKETDGWSDDDYRNLVDELNQEMKKLNYDPHTGAKVHNFDLDNTQYVAAIHFDSKGGIRHIHVVANRIDMDGNVIDDHYLGKRLLSAVHAINVRHGWDRPEDIHEEHLKQVNEACMESLKHMFKFKWALYGLELSRRGLKLKIRRDSAGKVVAYSIKMGNSNFKASILGTSRNLTVANIEKTWEKLHVSLSPSINSEIPSKTLSSSETKRENGEEQKSGLWSEQTYISSKPEMFYDEFEVEGKMIPIRIPENAYKIIKTDAENLCKETESTVEAITQTAVLLFLGYVEAAVSLAGANGGRAVSPTTGGGGSGSGAGWGKDPKEEEREYALRCARQAAIMCKPAPRRKSFKR